MVKESAVDTDQETEWFGFHETQRLPNYDEY